MVKEQSLKSMKEKIKYDGVMVDSKLEVSNCNISQWVCSVDKLFPESNSQWVSVWEVKICQVSLGTIKPKRIIKRRAICLVNLCNLIASIVFYFL